MIKFYCIFLKIIYIVHRFIFCVVFLMKNSFLSIILSISILFLFAWCSMMPNDEEIIRWSILDTEIFWEELVDDSLDGGKLQVDDDEWGGEIQTENADDENDEDDSEVQFEVVD